MMVLTHKRKNTPLLVGLEVDQIGFSMYLYLHLYPMMLICIRLFGYRYRLDSRISDVMRNPSHCRPRLHYRKILTKVIHQAVNRLLVSDIVSHSAALRVTAALDFIIIRS